MHYSRTAGRHRHTEIEPWREHFLEFSKSVHDDALDQTVNDVLAEACLESSIKHRPEGGKSYALTESRKKLMFYYKNKFSDLKEASPISADFWDG